MRLSILCSDIRHPVYPLLRGWMKANQATQTVELVHRKAELSGGDILFLISCHELIQRVDRERYGVTLVIHASDLPRGRGWSPHVWQILEGKAEITVTLLEAEDAVDSGAIWAQRKMTLQGHELIDEINEQLFAIELALMDYAVAQYGTITPSPQSDAMATYYPERLPGDSRIDPDKTIAEQFDLLRVADPGRYPAFFDYRGHRYHIQIEKAGVVDG